MDWSLAALWLQGIIDTLSAISKFFVWANICGNGLEQHDSSLHTFL